MAELPFGEYLNELLKGHGLKQETLHEFLAYRDESKRTSSGIKEQLRLLRVKSVPAAHYQMLPDIIAFFTEKGHLDTASRHRYIAYHQSIDLGLITTPNSGESRLKEKLKWLYLPEISRLESNRAYELWRFDCMNGDRELYRHSLSFFEAYRGSIVHAPVRRRILPDLSRIAILYGDYIDAYVIAKRFCDAWIGHIRSFSKDESTDNVWVSESAFATYLSVLQLQATAVACLSVGDPILGSSRLFRMAARINRRLFDRKDISQSTYEALRVQYRMRVLRMIVRGILVDTFPSVLHSRYELGNC